VFDVNSIMIIICTEICARDEPVKQKYCLIKFSLMNCMPGLLTQMLRQILPIKKYLPNFNVVKNAQWLKEISKTV